MDSAINPGRRLWNVFSLSGSRGRSPLAYEGHEVTHSRLQIFEILGASCVSVLSVLYLGATESSSSSGTP